MSGDLRRRWVLLVLFGLVVLLGAALREHNVATNTIGHVEVYVPGIDLPAEISNPQRRMTLKDTLLGVMVDQEPHPPGYYLFMFGWTKVFGTSALVLRLPSVVFGAAGIVLVFAVGAMERGAWTGLLAAALFALHGYLTYWSQIAKMYSLAVSLGLLTTVLLLLAWRGGPRRRLCLYLYVGATLAGLGTLVYFWLILLTHGLWIVLATYTGRLERAGILRYQILTAILGSPLVALAVFQGQRSSYLDPNPLPGLMQYLQFGFLFLPDASAIPPLSLPVFAAVPVLLLTLFLVAAGLTVKTPDRRDGTSSHDGPADAVMMLASVVSLGAILRFAKFAHGWHPARTTLILTCSILPLALLVGDRALSRYGNRARTLGCSAGRRLAATAAKAQLTALLAIVPVGLLASVSPLVPLFVPRAVLLFVPYLLVVVAAGLAASAKARLRWAVLLPATGAIFVGSAAYNRAALFEHPTDYRGLAEQWTPDLQASDLIFVQRHWALTPIFYYVKADRYQFIGEDYAGAVQRHPAARVWVLTAEGLEPPAAMAEALQGYAATDGAAARRIEAVLYTPIPR